MNQSLANKLVLCDLDNLLLGPDGNLTQAQFPQHSCGRYQWKGLLLAYACRHTARGRIQGRALYLAPSGGFPGAHPD